MRLRSPPLPPCRVPPNACLLELRKCEATVLAQLGIVLHSQSMHSGSQGLEWTHAKCSLAHLATVQLVSGLVEPHAHMALPVLM